MKSIILQEYSPGAFLLFFVLALLLGVIFFLLIREIMLWYWKINTIIANQEKQIALLSKLVPGQTNDDDTNDDDDDDSIETKARKYDETQR